jgi:hypothetical protein
MTERLIPVRRRSLTHCLLAVLAVAGTADPANAANSSQVFSQALKHPAGTQLVTSCADDGTSGTLRSVVATTVTGDTIDLTQLTCGEITLLTGQIDVHVDDLTINGPGQGALTIDGNYNGRVFNHDGMGTLTLSGLTITHGVADSQNLNPSLLAAGSGGCILSDHGNDEIGSSPYGSVALIDSTVTGCRATATAEGFHAFYVHGGGVCATRDLTVDRSTITNNELICEACITNGGGLFARYGVARVADSTIVGTRSETFYYESGGFIQAHGGGIGSYSGAIISRSIISNNFAGCDSTTTICAGAFGGGIFAINGAQIDSSEVKDNVAEAAALASHTAAVGGAGLYVAGDVTIETSTITNNQARDQAGGPAQRWGGGAMVGGTVLISGSTIDHNTADVGGAIFSVQGDLSLVNSTISNNAVADKGGGIFVLNGYPYGLVGLTLNNSTITLNTSAGSNGGAGIVDNHDPTLGFSDFESSIVAGNINAMSGATFDADLGSTRPNSIISGANNLIVAASGVTLPPDTISADPMLGPLQDNGGPTWTHALLTGSPAIDTGNNLANLDFDQRGEGFLRRSGAAVDIGAFELQTTNNDVVFADGFDGASP